MALLLSISYTAIFIALIYRIPFFRYAGISRRIISVFFILKILMGTIMFQVYSKYYPDRETADIFKYFDDSEVMFRALQENPKAFVLMLSGIGHETPELQHYYQQMKHWYREFESNLYNDSHTIIRFNALARLFSLGYYHVHTVFMCFLSLIGLIAIYRAFLPFFRNKSGYLLFAIFMLPSVLFWGSGVLKEGLLLFFLGLLLFHFFKITKKEYTFWSIFWIIVAPFMLFHTKFYVLVVAIPGMIVWLWCSTTNDRKPLLKFSIVIVGYFLISLLIRYGIPAYDPYWVIYIKQRDFLGLAGLVESGSIIPIKELSPSPLVILLAIPQAIFNVFFYPHIFQSLSLLNMMAALENLLLPASLIFSLFFLNKRNNIPLKPLLFSITFVMGLYALTGLITPVAGAIVRYKVPALPFIIIISMCLLDMEKLGKRFPYLRKLLQ